jgi:hypothetical protein
MMFRTRNNTQVLKHGIKKSGYGALIQQTIKAKELK